MIKLRINEIARSQGIQTGHAFWRVCSIPSMDSAATLFNNRNKALSLSTIEHLCNKLGVMPGDLFDYKPTRPGRPKPNERGKAAKSVATIHAKPNAKKKTVNALGKLAKAAVKVIKPKPAGKKAKARKVAKSAPRKAAKSAPRKAASK